MVKVTDEDREAWERFGPAIFHRDITGPEAFAAHREAARAKALEEAAVVAARQPMRFAGMTENYIRAVLATAIREHAGGVGLIDGPDGETGGK